VPPRSAAAYGSRLPTSAFTRVFDTLWAGTTRKCEWHSANSGDCLNEPLGEWTVAEAALLVKARKLTPVVRERAGEAERLRRLPDETNAAFRIGPIALGSIRQRSPQVVATQGVNFKNAIESDSDPLLHRKRVIGRLKPNKRTLSLCLRLNGTFQVQRIRIADQSVREPAEPRPQTALLSVVKCVEVKIEICAR
jgi:hypothetical protein